ncbi:thiol reductant ABC exporter subunit CydC [Mameliella sediminis]|uniref:thiol reductant ABC exporter subunit CydC n=1 Tax=Mameliella sediminis TaxID=2836866 RepID=UPI001C450D53|nr:thiol reductant ABC exporter subunit CydC [Mameliella sediminis]MBV7393647.1 thiol reductant ABC exporter subunit CydC [Mameliella sediminis]
MTAMIRIMALLWQGERRSFLRGFALSIAVLAMGAALLGLSGWFITAAAASGLAGTGVLFNVFAPSAMVRFLALGRTAARYGERLTTHDATLRALSRLRVRLLQGLLASPYRRLERLRANAVLNRVTADIDALDGLALRLILPGLAGLAVILMSSLALWFLVHPSVALVVGAGYAGLPTVIFLTGQRLARAPSRQAEAGLMALRSRLIDLVAARDDLTVLGQLPHARDSVATAISRHAAAQARTDRIERQMGLALDLIGAAIAAATLAIGATLAQADQITPARAAIGVFVALALGETVAPVRRALAEIGRMIPAARRVAPALGHLNSPAASGLAPRGTDLHLRRVKYTRPGGTPLFAPLDLHLRAGETLALTGPSGCGKSTVLLMAAGELPPSSGDLSLGGVPFAQMSPQIRRDRIAMVPQRHALIAGTVAGNLRLAAPDATDDDLWHALRATCLDRTIAARGGLDMRLGFRGAGLSGGEARRLVLARALLRRPALLILDEPTEGLDSDTARAVLAGVRQALPRAAILMAAHRPEETGFADCRVALTA